MAAIYSGIHLKLKNSKTPWEDKIKLAHFAWISHQCVLPNKEQVLLDWVCHTLTGCHTKKLNVTKDVEEKLWGFLDSILHSKKLQSLIKEGKSINLRFTIAQVINDFIASCCSQQGPPVGVSTVLNCCQGILSIPALSYVYTAKLEMMVDLLNRLSTLTCHYLDSEEPITPQVFDVLQMSFTQYLQIQRQQVNPNRVFSHVLSHLFLPCLLLRHSLNTRSWSKEDDGRVRYNLSKDIRSKTETVLQMGLFQYELLSSYKEELLPEKDQTEKKKGSLKTLLKPVGCILEKLGDSSSFDSEIYASVVTSSLPLVYKLFLDSYCKDGNQLVCFHMLVRLFDCLQTTVLQKKEDSATLSTWGMALFALEQMLNHVLCHDVYNVAVDRIRHAEIQYHFYRKLSEMLVYNPCTSIPAWFRCLKTLILLNHLIIEPDLDDLLSCAWIDADILDSRVRKAQEILIGNLLQTYAKLRQFSKLFKEILTVVCRPATDELREPVLSPGLTEKLSELLLELPPNQILDIWEMILEKYETVILPDIKGDSDLALKLFSLASVLHCLLFNMKTMDNNTPVPVLVRFQNLMKKMDKVLNPSFKIIKSHCACTEPDVWIQKLCDASLLLFSTWLEVDTATSLNCSKYISQLGSQTISTGCSTEGWDLSLFLEDKDCWKKVVNLSTGPVSKYCLGLLCVQKMKQILMQNKCPSETDLMNLQAAASFILHHEGDDFFLTEYEPWDGSASLVNEKCFPVAHWHLVISNLAIIHLYMSAEDTNRIGKILLETFLSSPVEENQADKDTGITLKLISASLLQSGFFPEMRILQCSFITSIIEKCAMSKYKDLSKTLNLLCARSLSWHEDFFSAYKKGLPFSIANKTNDKSSICLANMENASQHILSISHSHSFVDFSDTDLDHLRSAIECISILSPDSVSPSDQSRCFLLLLRLAIADCSCQTIRLKSTCYKLLTFLISGKHSNAVCRVLYASDILEIALSSLLTSKWEFGDNTDLQKEWPHFIQMVQCFLESFIGMIMERKQSSLLNMEKFVTFVVNSISNPASSVWHFRVGHLLLVALNTVCTIISQCLQEHYSNKQRADSWVTLLNKAVVKMGTIIHQCLKSSDYTQMFPSFFVSCITTLLEAELIQSSLMGISSDKAEFKNIELYGGFCSQILRELYCAEGQVEFLKVALHYLKICVGVKDIQTSQEGLLIAILSSVKKLLTGKWISVLIVQSIENELTELFIRLTRSCTHDEFHIMMTLVLQCLQVNNLWKQDYKEPFAGVVLLKLLLSCPLNGDNGKLFWFTAPQTITSLVTLCKDSCKDRLLIPTIIVPVLEALALLLRQGETQLTNPHHVTLSFSILLTVPLDHKKPEDYYSVFLGVHEVLFSILQYHSKSMLKAVPSFLSSFYRLVTSVMHEGRQKGEKAGTPESDVVLQCARLVERMFTYIAAKTEEFTVFSAFIVSQYVNELQKVTLQPVVKKHLTEGIFHILDLCIDRDIKFLNASLQMGVREVFKELYKDYNHYHKTKNQGEEKYTA
uniref:URB2 ribosome biosis homolog n=1 Tax=Leptobrachium leishanense TaxID=445787 RepID=A0A8C5MX29_9ANUR